MYYLGDNLGNTRITFGTAAGIAITYQKDDYYPFGLEINRSITSPKNEYLYNKKELQEEFTEYDYGARFYDPVVVHWNNIDPMAEVSRRWSPYNYVEDDPIRFIDPDGMETDDAKLQREALEWGHAKSAEAVGKAMGDKGGGGVVDILKALTNPYELASDICAAVAKGKSNVKKIAKIMKNEKSIKTKSRGKDMLAVQLAGGDIRAGKVKVGDGGYSIVLNSKKGVGQRVDVNIGDDPTGHVSASGTYWSDAKPELKTEVTGPGDGDPEETQLGPVTVNPTETKNWISDMKSGWNAFWQSWFKDLTHPQDDHE